MIGKKKTLPLINADQEGFGKWVIWVMGKWRSKWDRQVGLRDAAAEQIPHPLRLGKPRLGDSGWRVHKEELRRVPRRKKRQAVLACRNLF